MILDWKDGDTRRLQHVESVTINDDGMVQAHAGEWSLGPFLGRWTLRTDWGERIADWDDYKSLPF